MCYILTERPSVTINSEVVQLGNNAVLKCSSSSLTVTDIIWQHNRSPLHNDGDKYVIELSSNNLSTLTVTDIGEDDFGPYRCNITDDLHVNIFVTGYINHTSECVIITPYYVTTCVIITLTVSPLVSHYICMFTLIEYWSNKFYRFSVL